MRETDRVALVDLVPSLVQAFHAVRHPVIWVRQEFESDLTNAFFEMRRRNIRIAIKKTRGCETIPELGSLSDETQVAKKRYNAFFGRQLDRFLPAHSADTVVLAGINTGVRADDDDQRLSTACSIAVQRLLGLCDAVADQAGVPDGAACPSRRSGVGASSRSVHRWRETIKNWFTCLEQFALKTAISKEAAAGIALI